MGQGRANSDCSCCYIGDGNALMVIMTNFILTVVIVLLRSMGIMHNGIQAVMIS